MLSCCCCCQHGKEKKNPPERSTMIAKITDIVNIQYLLLQPGGTYHNISDKTVPVCSIIELIWGVIYL